MGLNFKKMEQITRGLTIVKSNEVVGSEPITLQEVKSYLGIDFSYHDVRLTSLIKSCRIALESLKMVTLITSRTVTVTWKEFYDYAILPFYPVSGDVSIKDLNDNDIEDSNAIVGRTFYGSYPDGVKLTYNCVKGVISDEVKDGLIRSVAGCFEKDLTPQESVFKEFKFVEVYG